MSEEYKSKDIILVPDVTVILYLEIRVTELLIAYIIPCIGIISKANGNEKLVVALFEVPSILKLKNNKEANVFELSSGEKQIIIMIAHLIFEEDQKPSGVFIIDEPELSLHIAWQEIFVDSITEASPKTQFILATHSPSIISKVKREQFCQDLNKLNT